MNRSAEIREVIVTRYPMSALNPISTEELATLRSDYPEMPSHLFDLYTALGCGFIGDSSYAIHLPTRPQEIYDPESAQTLADVVIVGDDFAGRCDAYNTRDWQFGFIDYNRNFEPHTDYADFPSFLWEWFAT